MVLKSILILSKSSRASKSFFISASLIKTVIGGAQIIDLMFLVIDAVKGMQTQTAECLILGEITCSKMIVILNKIDVFSTEAREKSIEKVNFFRESSYTKRSNSF